MPKAKTRIKYIISKDCRRPKTCREAFLEWVNSRDEFKRRKPRVEEVIAEARRKDSPLHVILSHNGCNTAEKAAGQYWRLEAQYYLRHVNVIRVSVVTDKILTKPIRAYIPVTYSRGGRIAEENYFTAQRVADNPSMKFAVVTRAYTDLQAWIERYERYAEFMGVFSEVVAAYKKLDERMSTIIPSKATRQKTPVVASAARRTA